MAAINLDGKPYEGLVKPLRKDELSDTAIERGAALVNGNLGRDLFQEVGIGEVSTKSTAATPGYAKVVARFCRAVTGKVSRCSRFARSRCFEPNDYAMLKACLRGS